MKQAPSNKYNIAWFKLSEFVARGEKEKALGIYKLLSLSIDDPAFICKLEGDILLSFNDKQAIDKYYSAAVMYQKSDRYIESVAVFESLLSLQPYSYDYLNKLLNLYEALNFEKKVKFTLIRLFIAQVKNNDSTENTFKQLEFIFENDTSTLQEFVYNLIHENMAEILIFEYIDKVITQHFNNNDTIELNRFMSKLETINEKYYQEAIKKI